MSDIGTESRKRRGSAFVTKNACKECKKRRSKCDGKSPCARCSTRNNVTCQYTVSIRARKEEMKADIERLQLYRKHSEQVLGSLAAGVQSELILLQLQSGERLKNICKGLLTRRASFEHTSSNSQEGIGFGSRSSKTGDLLPSARGRIGQVPQAPEPCGLAKEEINGQIIYAHQPWTRITEDFELIEHLASLYFCWEYPTLSSLSKTHFLLDFETGGQTYCSPLLVNVVSALGCRFSDRLAVRTTSVTGQTLGDQFYAEAERIWEKERYNPLLTTIQATGLMSLWETSRGRGSRSSFYSKQAIIMAIEMGLHLHNDDNVLPKDEDVVRTATFWGVYVLDQAWSLSLGCSPHLSGGIFKTRPPLLENSTSQPGNASIFNGLCDLSAIVCRSLHILYSSRLPLTSRDILSIYIEYLEWYDTLPQILHKGENSTPAMLFSYMYCHFVILLLFGPFVNLLLLDSHFIPKDICVQAADAISSLINSYSQLYGLSRTPSFVPYISLASSIIHLVMTKDRMSARAKVLRGISDLQDMIPSHVFAGRAIEILQNMAELSRVGQIKSKSEYTALMSSPTKKSIHFFSLGPAAFLPGETAPSHHSALETSIFSPFPTQVLALATFKEELRLNGFELT